MPRPATGGCGVPAPTWRCDDAGVPIAPTATLLARVLAAEPARPLITQYDDLTGERVELSATTVDNWVAKTANLLVAAGLEPGATAAVLLPPHWQTAVVLLGCWTAGLAVGHGPRGGAPAAADVAFATADRFDEALATGADEVYGLSLAPLAAPLPSVPPGVTDYATDVRGQGDRFPPTAADPDGPALVGALGGPAPRAMSHTELVAAATARAGELGLAATDRLLVTVSVDRAPRPLDWLLAPLAAGASVVLLRHPDPATLDHRAAVERVTARLP